MGALVRRGAHMEKCRRSASAKCWPRFQRRVCNTSYTFDCSSDENDMRCATGTPPTGAHINAHIIFPRTSVTSEMARKPFCQLRTSFCLVAQTILPEAQVI